MIASSFTSFSTAAAVALFASLPSAMAATYDVQVGPRGQFVYEPPYVNAAPGDVVNFIFNPKNHTVTQSSFDQPCIAVPHGTNSGFNPVAPDSTDPQPTFQVHVIDHNPVWFYCQQVNHCGSGMVFAINPGPEGSANSFSEFQQRAIALNGTASVSAATPTSTSTDTYVTPPPPHWETATATITHGESVWTTVYSSYDGTPPPSPAPEPQNHVILVGEGGSLTYDPPSIQAAVGDTVTFEFKAKNHTVTMSSFNQPCVRAVDPVTGELGFASGFQPVSPDATEFPTLTITINDTAPIWGYCGQTGHCGQGMVFAINAVESGPNNFAAFQELAMRINGTGVPGLSSSSGANPTGANTNANNDDSNAAITAWRPTAGAIVAFVGAIVAWAL